MIATFALVGVAQILGPASATAMIATGGEAQCNVTPGTNLGQTPSGQPCMVLEGGEIIVFEPAEEDVEISGTPPPSSTPEPELTFCERYPVLCHRAQKDRGGIKQQHGPNGSGGGGSETRGKPSKPTPKEKTEAEKKKEECKALARTGGLKRSDEDPRDWKFPNTSIDYKWKRITKLDDKIERARKALPDARVRDARSHGDIGDRVYNEAAELTEEITLWEREIARLKAEIETIRNARAAFESKECKGVLVGDKEYGPRDDWR